MATKVKNFSVDWYSNSDEERLVQELNDWLRKHENVEIVSTSSVSLSIPGGYHEWKVRLVLTVFYNEK